MVLEEICQSYYQTPNRWTEKSKSYIIYGVIVATVISVHNISIHTPGQALFALLTDSCPILRVGLNRDSSSVFCCCSNIALFLLRSASVAAFSTANLFSSAFISLFNSCTWLVCVCSRVLIASWCLQFEFCYGYWILSRLKKCVYVHSYKRLLFILL